MIKLLLRSGAFVTVEHPLMSLMFHFGPFRALLEEGLLKLVRVDQCMYGQGTPPGYKPRQRWKKPTDFAVSHDEFGSLRRICTGTHEHSHVKGSIRFNNRRVNRSKLAGRYPSSLCVAYARCVQHIMSHGKNSA